MSIYKKETEALAPQLGERVGALFTERLGGVSSGPWGGPEGVMGLNVGTRVGDNAACVRMNRAMVAQLVPQAPRWMTQVHGTRVVHADDVTDDSVEADASWTMTPGVVCAVQVADCLPMLVADADGRIVAAVHAGWRSLAAGIVEATVREMRLQLSKAFGEGVGEHAQLRAWLGPRIGFDDFETGPEVAGAFTKHFGLAPECVRQGTGDRCFIDLAGYARRALSSVGVAEVEDCALSTVADPARFYSYRRDGEKTGRHAALVWIRPQTAGDQTSSQ